jgi:antitoxin MazE
MRTRLTKWGNSLGIRLPKVFALQTGMRSGDEILVDVHDQSIVLSKAQTLDQLLARITDASLHGETDTGAVQGREIW